MKKLLFLALTVAVVIVVNAQDNLGETIKTQLVKDWERAKTYTKEYLDAMPADKYGFKAQDSIRSFAQQMLHLAQGNIGLGGNAIAKARPWSGNAEASKTAQGKDSVVYYVAASYDYIIDGIKAMDAAALQEKVKRGNLEETKLVWLMKAFEHQTHHRGQTTIYIRLLGIKPPNEKLF
jgi:uncharacterized damage-inducible protein DinB